MYQLNTRKTTRPRRANLLISPCLKAGALQRSWYGPLWSAEVEQKSFDE
jgi:hypothetical protein